jgi:uncharacterized membrane protein YdbT with pleckstrin-like domain
MDLMEGEALVWRGRPSWRAMMSFWFSVGLLAIVVFVLGLVIGQGTWSGLLAAVILVVGLIKGWLERVATLYTITDRRIIIRKGILSRNERAAHIDRVQNVNLTQSFFDRLFQVGTLDFDTAGTEDSDFKFRGIANPDELRARIDTEYVRRSREMPASGGV